ncbi:uncharacterized protein LOC34622469 [Cyclospora cayetanensis]|uniref:Uncharacterized protein LOC34622469 n=1 Tax=Cyclospora cayetanensis TaxID=88456 RepID=A0A6P6RX51_9EIME|nr:uncharacterized protein LOC34622469 [Cyclospora cayetanensis]
MRVGPCGPWGPLPPPRCFLLVLALAAVTVYGNFTVRAPPVGPTEEAEPFVGDSRWGKAVRHRWEDASYGAYLKEQIQRVNDFGYWVKVIRSGLEQRPEKEKRKQEQSSKKIHEPARVEKDDKNKGRRSRPTTKLAAHDEWLVAYQEDPFKGLPNLPLQGYTPGSGHTDVETREAVFLQQLEEENAFGSFRLRFQHLRSLAVAAHKRVFTAELPGASQGSPQAIGAISGGPSPSAQWGLAGGLLESPQMPEVNPKAMRMAWMEVAQTVYLPVIEKGPRGSETSRLFMEELQEAFELLDRELVMRTASESSQRLAMQQSSVAAAAAASAANFSSGAAAGAT